MLAQAYPLRSALGSFDAPQNLGSLRNRNCSAPQDKTQLDMILNPQRPSPVTGGPLKYSGEPVSAFELVPSLLERGIGMREGGGVVEGRVAEQSMRHDERGPTQRG